MGAFVAFRGTLDPWHPRDWTGFNTTGYVTDSGIVFYQRRSRIARTSIEWVEKRPHKLIDLSTHPRISDIETFFTQNRINNTLYATAVPQMSDPNSTFWDKPVKIPILAPISAEEHERRWSAALQTLQKGDSVCTFDTGSLISRIITYLDQGTWSHTATYAGDGNIIEATGSGVVERSIEVYRDPRYRLGVYRMPGVSRDKYDAIVGFLRSQVGKRYAYGKVALLGLRLIFGIWPSVVRRHTTPNMLITLAGMELLALV